MLSTLRSILAYKLEKKTIFFSLIITSITQPKNFLIGLKVKSEQYGLALMYEQTWLLLN